MSKLQVHPNSASAVPASAPVTPVASKSYAGLDLVALCIAKVRDFINGSSPLAYILACLYRKSADTVLNAPFIDKVVKSVKETKIHDNAIKHLKSDAEVDDKGIIIDEQDFD